MNQEDYNEIMWNSLPEWRKRQLRMSSGCCDEYYDKIEKIKAALKRYGDNTKPEDFEDFFTEIKDIMEGK